MSLLQNPMNRNRLPGKAPWIAVALLGLAQILFPETLAGLPGIPDRGMHAPAFVLASGLVMMLVGLIGVLLNRKRGARDFGDACSEIARRRRALERDLEAGPKDDSQ